MAKFINRENTLNSIFFNEVRKYKPITQEEERELVSIAQSKGEAATEARNKLILANIRFLASCAGKYDNDQNFVDYVCEGFLGFAEAVERYDTNKDVKLLTYANAWIKKNMSTAREKDSCKVSISDDTFKIRSKVNRAMQQFYKKNGYDPSPAELEEILGISARRIEAAMNCTTSVSFDAPYGDDDERTLGDTLFVDSNCEADYEANSNSTAALIRKEMKRLTPREQEVIEMVYGFNRDFSLSLGEIAERLGVSHESIRRTRERALSKLGVILGGPNYRVAC